MRMRTIIALSVCGIILTVKAQDQIRIVRHGTNVTEQPSAVFTTNVIQLVESCGFDSTDHADSTGSAVNGRTWGKREQSDSFVVLTFSPPRNLSLSTFTDRDDLAVSNNLVAWGALRYKRREIKSIDQILLPLPERNLPDHIFVRSGTNVFAVTKMLPFFLRDVAFEPVLNLRSGTAYESLAGLPASNK
jgi:hypothetical protein